MHTDQLLSHSQALESQRASHIEVLVEEVNLLAEKAKKENPEGFELSIQYFSNSNGIVEIQNYFDMLNQTTFKF